MNFLLSEEKIRLFDVIVGLVLIVAYSGLGAIVLKRENLKPLNVISYGPKVIGEEVKAKAEGQAVWFLTENVSYSSRVIVNGAPLKSVVNEKEKAITAVITPSIYRGASVSISAQVVDRITGRESNKVEFQP